MFDFSFLTKRRASTSSPVQELNTLAQKEPVSFDDNAFNAIVDSNLNTSMNMSVPLPKGLKKQPKVAGEQLDFDPVKYLSQTEPADDKYTAF